MSNQTKECRFTVEETLSLFLGSQPYRTIEKASPLYRELSKHQDGSAHFVLENEHWTVGYNNQLIGDLSDDMVRLWNRADWQNCDNKNKQALHRIELRQAEHRAELQRKRDVIAESMSKNGVQRNIIDILMGSYSNEQIEGLYNTIVGAKVTL